MNAEASYNALVNSMNLAETNNMIEKGFINVKYVELYLPKASQCMNGEESKLCQKTRRRNIIYKGEREQSLPKVSQSINGKEKQSLPKESQSINGKENQSLPIESQRINVEESKIYQV